MRLAAAKSESVEDTELELLLEGVFRHYGFDFRNYAMASLKRRIWNVVHAERLKTVSALQDQILHSPEAFDRFLNALSVNVSAMFRDPAFFKAFRQEVVPLLRTYPFIRIWHAGVSMGEEVYSLSILLEEEGIYERCRIYATDVNESVLKKAMAGVYPIDLMQNYTNNYIRAGGTHAFSEYYTASYDRAIFNSALRRNIVFAQHNLASDASFNEFHVILCRNVMIYFNQTLQAHVQTLLYNSLVVLGVLGIGSKESLRLTPHENQYEEIGTNSKIYRRVR